MQLGTVIYEYDSLRNRVAETTYNNGGKVDHKIRYEYDKMGRLNISRGKYAYESTYEYDQQCNVAQRIDYSATGDPIRLVKYSYLFFGK